MAPDVLYANILLVPLRVRLCAWHYALRSSISQSLFPLYLLNPVIISVKVLLILSKLLKIILKMHDLCETKLHQIGYKDINLL